MYNSPPWHSPYNRRARCRGRSLLLLFALFVLFFTSRVDGLAQSCGNPDCYTTSMILNTGYNHTSGATYGNNVFDAWWGIQSDNDPNTLESRRASVMAPYTGWPSRANAQWLWRDFLSSDPLTGTTVYYTQFEACAAGMLNLNMSVIIPGGGSVALNGVTLFTVPSGLAATVYNSGAAVVAGINTITVVCNNPGQQAAGINIIGSISSVAANLISRACGPYKNGVMLQLFDDLDQDGIYDNGEPGVSNTQVQMMNPSGQSSAFSTGDGRVWFETSAGNSIFTTLPNSPWMIISGTTHTVTLAAGASAVGLKVAMTTCPTVQVLKYNDRNCNGKQDPGEEGLGGWTINFSTGQQVITQPNTITKVKVCNTTSLTVTEVIPAGTCWVQTQPGTGSYTFTIQPGVLVYKAYFGNSSTGTLCVTKFNDLDGDGVRDPGEPGLPGWVFTITSATLSQQIQTDANGLACTSITCGTYTVCEQMQNGWCATTPMCRTVVVTACQITNVEFGNTQAAGLCIHKYNDRNCDGEQDPGEEDLSGWTFTVVNISTLDSMAITTGVLGVTCATVPAGSYRICELPKAGWGIATTACCASLCDTVVIAACETKTVTFANASTGTICAFKYNDLDGDGEYDAGSDLPLNNWTIEVVDPVTLVPIVTGQTDSSGFVCFELPLGSYRVREVQQGGWVATEPVPPVDNYLEQVTPCCSILNMFGNRQEDCDTVLCVHKYNDRNCNGVQEPGEEDLPGWEFTFTNGSTVIRVTTGSIGVTCATVSAGDWVVCEVTKAGWSIATTACCPSFCTTVTITTCGVVTVTFANASTGTICVFKYNDIDGDGNYDPMIDVALDNWPIEILDESTLAVVATGTTDPSGFVCFEMPLGKYYVKEVQQPGWVQTEPVLPVDRYLEEVTPCCSILNIFGNQQIQIPPCTSNTICITKFNDRNCDGDQDPGEEPLPNWQFTISNGATAVVVRTGPLGTTCATVTSGNWSVCETVQPGWTPTPIGVSNCRSVTVTCAMLVNVPFGNSSTGTVCITKFNDRNCDGDQDPGEEPLPNWIFTLSNGGGIAVVVTTNSIGVTCATLPAGNWTVCEIAKAGWMPTPPGATLCRSITVSTCATTQVVYGNSSTATICVRKFHDRNCDGDQDPGEEPLPNWTFTLNSGSTVVTLTTNSAGVTCATVPAGSWTVCELLIPGWQPTPPGALACRPVNISPCESTELVFGNSSTGTLCVLKFEDINGNGVQDLGEPPLAGWQFTVPGVGIITTNAAGLACVNVTSGNYNVCEILQPGWTNTTPLCQIGVVVPCQTTTLVFGNRKACTSNTICITKFNDRNCDGDQDPGEEPLPNWQFTLTNGPTIIVVTTGPLGTTCATVTSGNWSICEVLQPGWTPTPLGVSNCRSVTVTCAMLVNVPFGNSSTGTVCITKFNDRNCDGDQDPGEEVLPNWTFTLSSPSGSVIVTTNSAGVTCATLTAGNWTVCEVLLAGWVPTPAGATPCRHITVSTCATTPVLFGNSSTGTLCILKFEDINGNGIQDPGEPPLAGWQFYVPGVGFVTTNAAGLVCVNVTSGSYVVCETLQPGWINITPTCQTVSVTACQTSTLIFANQKMPCKARLCGTKYWERMQGGMPCNGVIDPNETGLPLWDIQILNSGTGVTTIVTTDINGNWCVDVDPGTYVISEILKWGFIETLPPGGSYNIIVNCGDTVRGLDFLNCACIQPSGGIFCKDDSIAIVSNPAVFNGNTVLVASPPPGPWPRNGVGPVPVPAPVVPGSQWIAPDFVFPDAVGTYVWNRYFCVCEGVDSTVVRIRLCFKGVHRVVVMLNGMMLGMYNTYPGGQTCIDTAVVVSSGCHALEFHVTKTNATVPPQAGLSYIGSLVGPGLIQDSCCSCYRGHVSPNVPVTYMRQKDTDERDSAPARGADQADNANEDAAPIVTGLEHQVVFDPALTSIPNPANGATTVYYTLPRAMDVQLELYNALGRQVLKVANTPQSEGRHSVPLDMADIPSGTYTLRLTAGGSIYTLQVVNKK